MKTMKLFSSITFVLVTIGFLAGCKKNKDEVKKPDCRIITITPSTGDAYNISYNTDGKLSTVSYGNNTTTYAYSGNTVIATTNISGAFDSKKIITVNAQGMALNVRTENNVSGTDWNNYVFEYSGGTQLIKSTYTTSSGGAPDITLLTWTNGNLSSLTSGSSVTTIDYYTDKPAQEGDYLHIAQLVQGYRIYKPNNLIKSVLSGSSITSFAYNFGTDGIITSLTASGSSASVFTYQHQCN
jgi:hypothetical protein